MIETYAPTSRSEWLEIKKSTIGASEAAALFGIHPWLTPFKLFALKTGQYKEERPGIKLLPNSIHLPPLERGNFMEEKAIELAQALRPEWGFISNTIHTDNMRPNPGHMFIDREIGLSSTPDAFVNKGDFSGEGTIQIKTVAPMEFDKNWRQDGEIQFPVHVGVQASIDATLSGCEWACAGALVNGYGVDFYLVDVPLLPRLMDRVRREVSDFWRRVRENDPYPPDFDRDGEVIRSLYEDDDGGEIDLSGNKLACELIDRREALKRTETAGGDACKERKTIDAELIHLLGNAARGTLADGRVIEAKTIRKAGFKVAPTTFRSIKIKQGKTT